jgi:prevent-host-death family protein
MTEVGVHEAKTHLSRLLRQVMAGDEVVITRGGEPIARLVPVKRVTKRLLGVEKGRFEVPDDFDAPLPDELLDAFES